MAEENNSASDQNYGDSKKSTESSYYTLIGKKRDDGHVMIGQEIEIFPDKELKDYATPGTRAFETKDRRTSADHYTLICEKWSLPRVSMISSYKEFKNPNIIRLHEAGVIHWAPDNQQKYAFVFEKPQGRKIMAAPDAVPLQVPEERLVSAVIQPIMSVLTEFRNQDQVHGQINPCNMFLAGAKGLETVILGECISSPPSYYQEAFFETISRGAARGPARGPGTLQEDLYALGMAVSMIARGENFFWGKSPQEIMRLKIENGSYSAFIGRDRIPGGISEFLRGVLADDESNRWTVNDVMAWLEGRRLSVKQPKLTLKAARPLTFKGEKYWDLRNLAFAFGDNIAEAGQEIEEGQFDLWLKRNFEDNDLSHRLENTWEKEKTSFRERMVSCMIMALDPKGPLRYKGYSIFPEGYGRALADAMARGEDVNVFSELLSQQLFSVWINQSFDEIPDASGLIVMFEKCRSTITQKLPGYGIERVAYMLNPELPCLSPMLKDHHVLVPSGILEAFEDLSKQADKGTLMFDRHIVAFISVREPKMIDSFIGSMNSKDRGTQLLGVIHTLAAIQRRFSMPPMPGVMNWIIEQMQPIIDMLFDRDLRVEVAKQMSKLKDNGNLAALLHIIDERQLIQTDRYNFGMAQLEYKRLTQEKNKIEGLIKQRKNYGRATGRQAAMVISATIAMIAIIGYLILRFINKGGI